MNENDDDQTDAGEEQSLASQALETAIALKTGLPPQVQRSFWKAVERVFTSVAEWPATYFEGKARKSAALATVDIARLEADAAQIRVLQQARGTVIQESAKAAAAQFDDHGLAMRALQFHGAQIVQDQKRIEGVLKAASDELKANPPKCDSSDVIEDDVLETILREGSRRSSEEFRILFGRILAGEVKSPGSFSIGTIQSLGRLSARTANDFQLVCNLSSSIFGSTKIITDPFGHAGNNSLAPFGIHYDNLARLIEEGLIRSDFSEWRDMPTPPNNTAYTIDHAGRNMLFMRGDNPEINAAPKIRVTGPAFTQSGVELRSIVTIHPSQEYLEGLMAWFNAQGVKIETPS